MKAFIRNYTPFIMLSYSLVFAVCSYFEFYISLFNYLGDLIGFSIFTNVFMLAVYWNKKYCASTKICVLGLIALNICNMIYKYFDVNYALYDIYLILTIFMVLILKR